MIVVAEVVGESAEAVDQGARGTAVVEIGARKGHTNVYCD